MDSASARPTLEFDQHSAEYTQHSHEILDEARRRCPVAWTDSYDGFWVVTKYDDVERVLSDWENFSSDHDVPEEIAGFPSSGTGYRGVSIPEGVVKFVPTEADPPLSSGVRRLENKHFSPKALRARQPFIEQAVDEALDAVAGTGRIEFAHDLAVPVPLKVALPIMGIPAEEWETFSAAESMFHLPAEHPDFPYAAIANIQQRVMQLVKERRADPRDDVASSLVHGQVDGRSLTDAQVGTILNGLSFAGAHTVTSLLLFAFHWLGDKPDVRQQMLEDEALMSNGIEEFLRYLSPFQGSARNVTVDQGFHGQELHHHERVYASMAAANRDPARFECPHEIRLDRENAKDHLAFSAGLHRCLGAGLAKLQARIILTKVFQRLPDYRIADGVVHADRIGSLNTFVRVPATFTAIA